MPQKVLRDLAGRIKSLSSLEDELSFSFMNAMTIKALFDEVEDKIGHHDFFIDEADILNRKDL